MTTPKSFTTEIEWFLSSESLPIDGIEVLISPNGFTITDAEFYTHHFGELRPHFLSHREINFPCNVKYWAYCPTFPEVK